MHLDMIGCGHRALSRWRSALVLATLVIGRTAGFAPPQPLRPPTLRAHATTSAVDVNEPGAGAAADPVVLEYDGAFLGRESRRAGEDGEKRMGRVARVQGAGG